MSRNLSQVQSRSIIILSDKVPVIEKHRVHESYLQIFKKYDSSAYHVTLNCTHPRIWNERVSATKAKWTMSAQWKGIFRNDF